MKNKMKVLLDVEISNEETNLEFQSGFGRVIFSCQACGGGGCGCGGGRYLNHHIEEKFDNNHVKNQVTED